MIEVGVPELDEHYSLLLTLPTDLPHHFEEAKIEHLLWTRIVSLLVRRKQSLILKEFDLRLAISLGSPLDLFKQLLDFHFPLQLVIYYTLLVRDILRSLRMSTDYIVTLLGYITLG